MRPLEDTVALGRKAELADFAEKWGIDLGSARELANNDIFHCMLEHINGLWMETLVEENDHDTLLRNQGSVRIIRDLLGLQGEVKHLQELDLPPTEPRHSAEPLGDVR